MKTVSTFEFPYSYIKRTFGINPFTWDNQLKHHLYQILIDLFSFSLKEVDPSSQSESLEEGQDNNETKELHSGTGLPKVKEKSKANVTVWKNEIEVAGYKTKLMKSKNSEYKSPLILNVLAIKDVKIVGIKLSYYIPDMVDEITAYFPYTPTAHVNKEETEDIKEFVRYFNEKNPNPLLKFLAFNSETKVMLRRMKDGIPEVLPLDLWKVIPYELLFLWDFNNNGKNQNRKEPIAISNLLKKV